MKKVICFYMLIILSLVSCTACEQIPTSTPVLSSTPIETLVSTTTPTKTPEATQTEISYSIQPLILKDQSELVNYAHQ